MDRLLFYKENLVFQFFLVGTYNLTATSVLYKKNTQIVSYTKYCSIFSVQNTVV